MMSCLFQALPKCCSLQHNLISQTTYKILAPTIARTTSTEGRLSFSILTTPLAARQLHVSLQGVILADEVGLLLHLGRGSSEAVSAIAHMQATFFGARERKRTKEKKRKTKEETETETEKERERETESRLATSACSVSNNPSLSGRCNNGISWRKSGGAKSICARAVVC